jgi:hypothetical protein
MNGLERERGKSGRSGAPMAPQAAGRRSAFLGADGRAGQTQPFDYGSSPSAATRGCYPQMTAPLRAGLYRRIRAA